MPNPQKPDDDCKTSGNPDQNDVREEATQQPPPPSEYADREDAGKGEIVVYSLGGVIDEFTTSSFRNLGAILIIVFGMNPLVIGFISAIKSIWDGIMDPIVAHWSDNCNSRFGRRRPFILAGGLMMAIVAWITWQFMPHNPNMVPNDPVVPEVFFSDQDWKEFGELLLAYGVDDFNIEVEVLPPAEGAEGRIDPEMVRGFAADSVKSLSGDTKALVKLKAQAKANAADEESDPLLADRAADVPTYTVSFRPLGASAVVVPGPREPVEGMFDTRLEVTVNGPAFTEPITSTISARTVEDKVNDEEIEIPFLERIVYFFIGEPEKDGMILTSEAVERSYNILEHRRGERAVMGAMRMGMIDAFSRGFGLPYWSILPEETPFADEARQQITDVALRRLQAEPTLFLEVLRSVGVTLNLEDDVMTEQEQARIDAFLADFEDTDTEAVFLALYGEFEDLERAASYHIVARDPLKTRHVTSIWDKIGNGFAAIFEGTRVERQFAYWVLAMFLLMAMAQTFYTAAYYAQGIEIAPSYNGRTLVTAYRSVTNAIISIIVQFFLPLSLLPIFLNAREGSLFLVYIVSPIGILLAFLVFFGTKERTVIIRDKKKVGGAMGFFKAVREIGSNREFWRILGLYLFMGYAIGSFQGLGGLVSVYYVFDGNLVVGASYNAIAGMIASGMGLLSIPVYVYLCKTIGKHNTLKVAAVGLALGSAIKYWCYNPDIPELLWIPPLLYSPAIGMFYNVLGTMMGDVIDLDELRHGERREGMFGAVMAIVMKSLGAFTAIASGFIIIASGFEVGKGVHQDPGVYHNMLVLFSIVPGVCALGALLLLANYPLTADRVKEIKAELTVRREKKAKRVHDQEANGSQD